MTKPLESKFIGSLLGLAIGDILGAPIEGMPRKVIQSRYGKVTDFMDSYRGYGKYTDDTQMALALGCSIHEMGNVSAKNCAKFYMKYCEPARGYGGGALKILQALKNKADYRNTGTMIFPNGSFGNGGAMRIAPVGLVYRNTDNATLKSVVKQAIMCTHVHPEAIDGAVVQAKAVAYLTKIEDPHQIDISDFLSTLKSISETSVLTKKIDSLIDIHENDIELTEAVALIGNGIKAIEAVPCAILAVFKYHNDPEEAIIQAVNMGGDTDTIGAMVGAQVGALHGKDWIPDRWVDNMENQKHGRDFIIQLAQQLVKVDV